MPNILNVTGSAWTPGMQVTAANVGIDTISSTGTLEARLSQAGDLWPGAVGNTLLQATANATISLRMLNPSSAAAAGTAGAAPFGPTPANGNKHAQFVWVRAIRTDPTLTGADTNLKTIINRSMGTNFILRVPMQLIRDANAPAHRSGLCLWINNNNTGAGTNVTECGHSRDNFGGQSNFAGVPDVEFERWFLLGLEGRLNATGRWRVLINGIAVGECTGASGTTAAQVNDLTLVLPALPGIQWQIGGMSAEYAASGNLASSQYSTQILTPSNYALALATPVTFVDAEESSGFSGSFTAGSGAAFVRPYSFVSGIRPQVERLVVGLDVNSTYTKTRRYPIGALPFSPAGHCWIVFNETAIRPFATGTWRVNDSSSNSLVTIGWSGITGRVTIDGQESTLVVQANRRYVVAIRFSNDGTREILLINITDDVIGAGNVRTQIVQQCNLIPWTVQSIGTTVETCSVGATGDSWESGGVSVHRALTLVGVDSYVSAPTTAYGTNTTVYLHISSAGGDLTIGETVTQDGTNATATVTTAHLSNGNLGYTFTNLVGTPSGSASWTGNTSQVEVSGVTCIATGRVTAANNSTLPYAQLRDAEAPMGVSYFRPVNGWVPHIVAPIGRSGRPWTEIGPAAIAPLAASRGVLLMVFGGAANSLALATTPAAAATTATQLGREINLTFLLAAGESEVVWELPAFGTAGGFVAAAAGIAFSRMLDIGRVGFTAGNFRRRLIITDPGSPAFGDGIHYSAAGAAAAATNALTARTVY